MVFFAHLGNATQTYASQCWFGTKDKEQSSVMYSSKILNNNDPKTVYHH